MADMFFWVVLAFIAGFIVGAELAMSGILSRPGKEGQVSKPEQPEEPLPPRVKLIPMQSTWTCPKCNHQNIYRQGIVSDPQNKCSVCGTEVTIGAIRSTDAHQWHIRQGDLRKIDDHQSI